MTERGVHFVSMAAVMKSPMEREKKKSPLKVLSGKHCNRSTNPTTNFKQNENTLIIHFFQLSEGF